MKIADPPASLARMTTRNTEFLSLLASRGLNIGQLAGQIFSGRAHLTTVLNGRRKGTRTWRRLERVLTKQEYDAAKRFADGRIAENGLPETPAVGLNERERKTPCST